MSYTCPVCNNCIEEYKHCYHDVSEYTLFVYWDELVNIYKGNDRVMTIKNPRRLDEEYIDKMLLLK